MVRTHSPLAIPGLTAHRIRSPRAAPRLHPTSIQTMIKARTSPAYPKDPRTRHRLDEHLEDVAEVLRLDDTRRKAAEIAFAELHRWIASDPLLDQHSPWLYVQGSFLIRTTVRPRRNGRDQDEFDLDVVVEFRFGFEGTPDELFELVWARIRSHPKYGRFAEKKRRCVCLNFPGEFHMDVLPARPDDERRAKGYDTAIEVPDRRLDDWKQSDPLGYAGWFEHRSRERSNQSLALAGLIAIQEDPDASLDALRRTAQLTKRRRDVVFNGADDAPRSIVLTTLLAGNYYGRQSTYLALRDGVARVHTWADAANGVPEVRNPVNEQEDFADAWDDASFEKFRSFVADFLHRLVALEEARGPIEIKQALAELFDEDIATAAMKRYAGRYRDAAKHKELRYEPKIMTIVSPAAAASLAGSVRPVPGGINFGD